MSSLGRTEALLPSSDCNRIEHRVAALFVSFFFPPPLLNNTLISPNSVPCLSISILFKDAKAQTRVLRTERPANMAYS